MWNHEIYRQEIEKIASMDFPWEKLHNKTVTVTGATGMTASALVDVLMKRNELYQEGIRVVVISRSVSRIRKRFADYLDQECFHYIVQTVGMNVPEMGDSDYIFHGAGYTISDAFSTDPIGTVIQNITGTHKLLSYASTHHTEKLIYFSSVDIYGTNRGDIGRFHEEYCGYLDCNKPQSGFAESRRLGESFCEAYGEQYGFEVCIARLSKIYGPGMDLTDNKTIVRYMNHALHGEDILMQGNQEEIYSYCYVADAVAGLLYIAFFGKDKEAYNIANNKTPLSARLLAKLVADMTGVSVKEDENVIKPYLTSQSYANNFIMDEGKLTGIGWKPETDIVEGLKKTLQFYNEEAEFV